MVKHLQKAHRQRFDGSIYMPQVCDDFALAWKTTCSHEMTTCTAYHHPARCRAVVCYLPDSLFDPNVLSTGLSRWVVTGVKRTDRCSLGESQARERSDCCSMADVWLDVQLQDFCCRQFNTMVFYFVGRVWRTEIPLLPNNFTERLPIIR